MKTLVRGIGILLCIWGLCTGMCAQAEEQKSDASETLSLFEDGDVVGFIGDSITHAQNSTVNYVSALYQYYLSCYPERKVEFRNLSTAGYKASDILNIYGQDPAFCGINKAVIMLGTNEAILKTPVEDYLLKMELLIETLKKNGLQVENILILSPPICDERVASSAQWKFEDRLLEYMEKLEIKAEQWGVSYLDLHTPMIELTKELQVTDSSFTLTTGDAIHPSPVGQLFLAYYILEAQGLVGTTDVVWTSDDDLYQGKIGQYWIVKQDGLPLAVTEEWQDFVEIFESGKELHKQLLKAEGLVEDTTYRVYMDETELGCFLGKELSEGIDLSRLEANPFQLLAKQIEKKVRDWHQENVRYRNIWIGVMMQQVTYTEEQIQKKHDSWKAAEEALREEIQSMIRDTVGISYRVAIVEDGYSVEELLQEAKETQEAAQEQARKDAEEKLRQEAEEKLRQEAEEKARKESEELLKAQPLEPITKKAKRVPLTEYGLEIAFIAAGVLFLLALWRKAHKH